MWLLYTLFISLLLTIIVELLFFILIGIRDKKNLLLACLINMITNPPVVLCYYLISSYTDLNMYYITIILELGAILTESYYYRTYGSKLKHPYSLAISTNIVSYSIGVIMNYIF